jgi:hypothetical protein
MPTRPHVLSLKLLGIKRNLVTYVDIQRSRESAVFLLLKGFTVRQRRTFLCWLQRKTAAFPSITEVKKIPFAIRDIILAKTSKPSLLISR